MSQPPEKSASVSLAKAWTHLMSTMGGTNLQRVRDARKAANALRTLRRTR